MIKKTTSLKVDPVIWKQVKKHCLELDIYVSEYIEKLVIRDLKLEIKSFVV